MVRTKVTKRRMPINYSAKNRSLYEMIGRKYEKIQEKKQSKTAIVVEESSIFYLKYLAIVVEESSETEFSDSDGENVKRNRRSRHRRYRSRKFIK